MKRRMTIMALHAIFLFACAPEETAVEEGETEVVDVIEPELEDEEAPVESGLDHQIGDLVEGEEGSRRIVGQLENLNETQETGPFEVTLLHAQLSQFQPSGEFVERFGGDDLVLVAFYIETAHQGEDTHTLYPDQGYIETDAGEQVHAEMFLTDQVGGEFVGETTKTGTVYFLYEGDAQEVSQIRYVIEGPKNHNAEDIGDDMEMIVDF